MRRYTSIFALVLCTGIVGAAQAHTNQFSVRGSVTTNGRENVGDRLGFTVGIDHNNAYRFDRNHRLQVTGEYTKLDQRDDYSIQSLYTTRNKKVEYGVGAGLYLLEGVGTNKLTAKFGIPAKVDINLNKKWFVELKYNWILSMNSRNTLNAGIGLRFN